MGCEAKQENVPRLRFQGSDEEDPVVVQKVVVGVNRGVGSEFVYWEVACGVCWEASYALAIDLCRPIRKPCLFFATCTRTHCCCCWCWCCFFFGGVFIIRFC